MTSITVTINGERRTLAVEPYEMLLDFLRNRLGIKSPKCGCDRGDCGACSVLLNGASVRSCIILAIEVDGHEIVTVEGLSQEGLTEVQQKFLEKNAFQCGFCAPGIIISTTELLQNNPCPSLVQVKEALSGNLCRCTGYTPIIDAILSDKGHKCHE